MANSESVRRAHPSGPLRVGTADRDDRTLFSQLGISQYDVANDVLVSLSSSKQTSPNYWLDPKKGIQYPLVVQSTQRQVDSVPAIAGTPITPRNMGTDSQLLGNLGHVKRDVGSTDVTHYNVAGSVNIVVVPWAVSCGHCLECRRGLTAKCSTTREKVLSAYGFGAACGPWGGMIADELRVPFADHMLVAIPNEIPPLRVASASDNLADAWRCVAPPLQERPGGSVLVLGDA